MDDGPRPITDADERAAVRAQARRILLESLAVTAAVGLFWGFIVYGF